MKDANGRKIEYLRISVTDRCNERCLYCMPPEGVTAMAHEEILTYDEILRLVGLFAELGVRSVRLTGGEPLVRRGLSSLVAGLKDIPGIQKVSLTTNALLLADQLPDLISAGLDSVNISLDTCDPVLYERITRTGRLEKALEGIEAAASCPALQTKLDCVILGMPEQRLTDVAAFAKDRPIHVRYIEMMPIGLGREAFGGKGPFAFKSCDEVRRTLEKAYGPLSPVSDCLGDGPAVYESLPGFAGRIGFIGALSHKYCQSCNRVRLTSQGYLKTCLQYETGGDLRGLLRNNSSDEKILSTIQNIIEQKPLSHSFLEEIIPGEEEKTMSQIGG